MIRDQLIGTLRRLLWTGPRIDHRPAIGDHFVKRAPWFLLGPVSFLVLLLITYSPVLFDDGQFAYRDAGGDYYPLYHRVQQEWAAHRWPLWDPWQNAGTPLLGNPMAAVLYPGKVLYALLPYPWAARLYVVSHTTIAFVGVLALGRSCGVSTVGSYLGGLSYAFGAPILFQYCNVIFLVGASWIPWGLRAIDQLLRQGRRRGGVELAAVLALQVLGGDPESAFLTALCGAGYAVVLAIRGCARAQTLLTWPRVLGATCIWGAATLGLACARLAPPRFLVTTGLVLAAWVAVGIAIAMHWHRRRAEARLAPMLAALAGPCIFAMALAAVQILPALEFASQSRRVAGNATINMFRFSLDPFRIVELVWPNVFGTPCPEDRSWVQAIPPVGEHELWVDSLYMGGLSLVLGLSAAGFRGGPAWRSWLTTVAVVGLVVSFGKYGSPLWWARWGPFDSILGPRDPVRGQPRVDPFLNDGAGSPYGILAMLLPGFGAFRYPSKWLSFTAAAMAILAGAGWDRLTEGETRRPQRVGAILFGASLVGLDLVLATRNHAVAYLTGRGSPDAGFGPPDITGSWAETQQAFIHGAIVFAVIVVLARWAPRRHWTTAALALLLLAADLAVANARLIWTAPQVAFDAPSEAARLIDAAERSDPSPGPFRVHRMSPWYPVHFSLTRSPDRLREMITWGQGTLQPMFGLPFGLQYCRTQVGAWELDDYNAFFRPQAMPVSAEVVRTLGLPAGQPVLYFPRRCFDLWGARYFLLPALPDWMSRERGFASFLDQTDLLHPGSELLQSGDLATGGEPWGVRQDWQLRRNRASYPRAWLVHYARFRPPVRDPDARAGLIRSLAFMNDPLWNDPSRTVLDLRAVALIETDDKESLRGFISPSPVGRSESVAVVKYEPQRVELRASLERPGLVILADTYYPGWRLSIDGKAAPIYRTNLLMRGAAVPTGEHTLVYTYEPESFRIGAIISIAGLIVLVALALAQASGPDLRGS